MELLWKNHSGKLQKHLFYRDFDFFFFARVCGVHAYLNAYRHVCGNICDYMSLGVHVEAGICC